MTARHSMTRPGTARGAGRAGGGARRMACAALARIHPARGGFGSADRHRGDPSRPVPDRVPDDPDDRLAVPAAGNRGLRPRAGGAGHPQPARHPRAGGGRGRGRLRPGYPRRLPAVGLDRAVRVQGGPHGRRHRRRPGGSSRLRGPGRARACSRAGERPAGGAAAAPARFPAQIPPAAARAAGLAAAGRRLLHWCCSGWSSPEPALRHPPARPRARR